MQEQIRDVDSGCEHASIYFLSKTPWLQQMDGILHRYNHERQEGQLQASPLEAWNANLLAQGMVQLGEKARFLLAHHKIPVKVQPTGIRLRSSLGGGLYFNHAPAPFAVHRML